MKTELINILEKRGFLYQSTNHEGLSSLLADEKIKLYCGFDCTAKSLHVGNLVNIMMMRWFQKFGHTPIILVGGATTMIGDPSGKTESRAMLSKEIIEENKSSIASVFQKFLHFNQTIFVDNKDWLSNINYLDFLRDYGRHFSINKMITFDTVRSRLESEQSLSFLEFNYMLLQAYDFLELYNKFECKLQIGGSDQWGNIVNGIQLVSKIKGKELFGMTCPLITTSSGVKMGKSVSGAIWLNQNMCSPYDYWQFWRNTEDNDVTKFLNLFTELDDIEIEKLSNLKGSEINEAKIILANEATRLCHGPEASKSAHQTAINIFNEKSTNSEDNLIQVNISQEEINSGIKLFQLFTTTSLADSNSAAKKLIMGGGAKYNNQTISDPNKLLNIEDFQNGKIVLSAGKKRHALCILMEK